MRKVLAVVATLVGLSAPAAQAQDVAPAEPVSPQSLMRQLSLRLDALQTRSDLLTPGGDAFNSGFAIVGEAKAVPNTTGTHYDLSVDGWGLICSALSTRTDFGRPEIVVDDVETGVRVRRYRRVDVEAILTPQYCIPLYHGYAPLDSGIRATVDVRSFGLGPDGDHWHTVKIRIYDLFGRMRDSVPVRVFIP